MIMATIRVEYCNDNFAGCVKANMPNVWHDRLGILFDLFMFVSVLTPVSAKILYIVRDIRHNNVYIR